MAADEIKQKTVQGTKAVSLQLPFFSVVALGLRPNSGRARKEPSQESQTEAKTRLESGGHLTPSTAGGAAAPAFALASINEGRRWNFKVSDLLPVAASCWTARFCLALNSVELKSDGDFRPIGDLALCF